MFLKLIMLITVLVVVYKLFGGAFTIPKRKDNSQDHKNDDSGDTLEECHACDTYVTRKESLMRNGKYYCSKECMPSR